jgi:hypothetical protein
MIMAFEELDDVDNENCKENKEKDHEDKDDDDEAKLVVLRHMNEKIITMKMIISSCLLVLIKIKMIKNYMKAKLHGCSNISTKKIF